MRSRGVERTWIRTGGYGWFRGEWAAALKHGIRNLETETETETEMEHGIHERRFQVIDLKKKISNNNKINNR